MRKGAWKKHNWDTWTLGKKIRHVFAVIGSIICVILMFAVVSFVVLYMFGLYGFILHARDSILLGIMHSIFG